VYALPGSPCDIAGIPRGTVITAINGTAVGTLEDLQSYVIRERPRTIVKLTGFTPSADVGATSQVKDWFVMLSDRPSMPGEEIFDSDIESRALLPVFGLELEKIGNTKKYTVTSVIRGSIADESGFSAMDVIEIKSVDVNREDSYVSVQLYTKKRKAGYLESYIGLAASLDSPSYF
jgi:C-terminal processing protease CtpA/Prc